MKIVSPVILDMSFVEAVVDTHCVRDESAYYPKVTSKQLALQIDPNRRDGEGRWRMGRTKRRREEAR